MDNKCICCGVSVPEGRQVCPNCEKQTKTISSERIKAAMQNFTPVEFDGKVYDCITAYIYRVVKDRMTSKYKGVFQVELLDKCKFSVVIAPIDKIKILDESGVEND